MTLFNFSSRPQALSSGRAARAARAEASATRPAERSKKSIGDASLEIVEVRLGGDSLKLTETSKAKFTLRKTQLMVAASYHTTCLAEVR